MTQDLLLGAALSSVIEAAINRAIELDPVGCARRRQLAARTLKIESTDPELSLCLLFDEERLRVEQDPELTHQADATVRGTLTALVRDFTRGTRDRDEETEVLIDGDVEFAHTVKQLFRELEPDFEEALASMIGDRSANIMGGVIREGIKLTRNALEALVRRRGGDDDGAP